MEYPTERTMKSMMLMSLKMAMVQSWEIIHDCNYS